MKIQDLLFKCSEKIAQYGFTDRVDGQTIQLVVCRGAQRVIDLENMLIAEREEKRRFELLSKDLSKQLEDATEQLAGNVGYKEQWDGYINHELYVKNNHTKNKKELSLNAFRDPGRFTIPIGCRGSNKNILNADVSKIPIPDIVSYLEFLLRSAGFNCKVALNWYKTSIDVLIKDANPISIQVMAIDGTIGQLFEMIMKIVKSDLSKSNTHSEIQDQELKEKDK